MLCFVDSLGNRSASSVHAGMRSNLYGTERKLDKYVEQSEELRMSPRREIAGDEQTYVRVGTASESWPGARYTGQVYIHETT
jgi:hypothetical protein